LRPASEFNRTHRALANVILDDVPADLDGMMRLASEMLVACALIIEREIGPDNARAVLRLTDGVLAPILPNR
jgi:hypothetical protein